MFTKKTLRIVSLMLALIFGATTLVGCGTALSPEASDSPGGANTPWYNYGDDGVNGEIMEDLDDAGNVGMADTPSEPGSLGATEPESNESYTQIVENAFVKAAETPDSYFSIDANTASYPNLRSLINNGYTVTADAVRVEEILNYFTYDYVRPTDGSILSLNASLFTTPYNQETMLLTVGLAAQEVEFEQVENNLVFLLDTSGSMYDSDKLPLVQQAFMMLAENLGPNDRVSIVTYAGSSSVKLQGARGDDPQRITEVIEGLQAAGSTAGSAGIETAYALAREYFIEGGNNRVIMATDGDFNVGLQGVDALKSFISEKRESGVYFSIIGVGRGNLKNEIMEALALAGNGTYHYIDSVKEARRAMVEQIGGTMVTVAKDVKAGITFDPDYVESYRLIGYENKQLTQDQFEDDATDAGELGSGHTVTVVYEIKPTEALRSAAAGTRFADVQIKYKPSNATGGDDTAALQSQLLALSVTVDALHDELTDTDRFVAGVVEFALLARNSQYAGDATAQDLLARLGAIDTADDPYRAEFVALVETYFQNINQ